ncbi:uncharacterized protein EHS24_002042 [Apiotrichum porosum]|uniref:RRM domain-containing protein n=1 Tax=Apiotrichum porosum TaxID=105984 RepID=A0A427XHT4_9TREE|nr:uncharacterized protein EHS24_002042 [Apiotrichum porosum]RSH78323.1 hypothetical protein EHS24_002042 [Apiotrichum porosum]
MTAPASPPLSTSHASTPSPTLEEGRRHQVPSTLVTTSTGPKVSSSPLTTLEMAKSTDTGSPVKPIPTLDPRSTVFKPLRPIETPAAKVSTQWDSVTKDLAANGDQFVRGTPPRARLSLQSAASTVIDTPRSQRSLDVHTPSTDLTWASSAFTGRTLFTPPSNLGFDSPRNNLGAPMAFKTDAPAQEELGRFLMINNVPRGANGEDIRQIIKNIAPYRAIIVKHLRTKGWVYEKLQVSSIRFGANDPLVQLHCSTISSDVVRQITGSGEEWDQVWQASEATVRVQIHGPHGVSIVGMEKCLSTIGDLKTFAPHDASGKSFSAEYYDTRRAADAIRVLNNQAIEDGVLSVRYASDDPFQSEPLGGRRDYQSPSAYTLGSAAYSHSRTSSGAYLPPSSNNPTFNASEPSSPSARHDLASRFDGLRVQSDVSQVRNALAWAPPTGPEVDDMYPHEAPPKVSPISRHLSDPGALQGMLNQMDHNARARRRQSVGWSTPDRQAIPPENRVFPERIVAGFDTRTTVMVKDVPNKLSRQELINILSEVVPNEFDFVYLRFDFNNHCNVGYAFVNFTSVKALYTFIQSKVGKKWNMFSSEKVLQVSYANIQGKVSLVNKFRNSAVMDVIEEWRPQIFYSNGALKGKPEPFPEADNPSARNRSTAARLSFLSGSVTRESLSNDPSAYDYSASSSHHGF